jgi:hypothetical protein
MSVIGLKKRNKKTKQLQNNFQTTHYRMYFQPLNYDFMAIARSLKVYKISGLFYKIIRKIMQG